MLNHVGMQGRLVSDPEFGTTASGVDYCNFRIAWSEKVKDRENRCFLDCKAFSGTARFVNQYFRKGTELLVEGKLTTEEWEKDGQKRSKIALVVNNVHFCGKWQEGNAAESSEPEPVEAPVGDGEMPF